MARPTEFFRPKIVGRGPCAPPHLTGNPLPTSIGGDTHIAPPFDQNIPSNRVGGAASPTPCDRRNCSYILECERQRRRKQVDTKLRPRPIDNPLADRKGSQETIRFPALLWVPSVRTESTQRCARNRWFLAAFFAYFFAAAGKKFVAEGIPNEKGRAKARPFALSPAK